VPALRRVGHKGADLIAPGNTAASFDAALDAGVDMIEFDVLASNRDGTGELYLAHDYAHLEGAPTFADGLAHLASDPFADVELDVDLKLPGYELRVVEALRAFGMVERALVSSMYRESLARVRAAEPRLRLGWSAPRVRRDYTTDVLTAIPALAFVTGYRAVFPFQAQRALRDGTCDAIMAHWRLVSRALVRAVHGAGGELYVWTVDDRERIARLESLGVDGVITNDPRLFVPSTDGRA